MRMEFGHSFVASDESLNVTFHIVPHLGPIKEIGEHGVGHAFLKVSHQAASMGFLQKSKCKHNLGIHCLLARKRKPSCK